MYKNIVIMLLMYNAITSTTKEIHITFEQMHEAEISSKQFCADLIEMNKVSNPLFDSFITKNTYIFNNFKKCAQITRKLIYVIPGYAQSENNRKRLKSLRNELLQLTTDTSIKNQIYIICDLILYSE